MNEHNICLILQSCVNKIHDLDESIWWIHEESLLDVLQVDYSGVCKIKCIDLLVKLLTKGKLSSERDGIDMKLEKYDRILNFYDHKIDNDLSFWCEVNCYKSHKQVRWFTKGKYTTLLKLQKTVMKVIIGHEDSRLMSQEETRKRCQSNYIDWYHGKKGPPNLSRNMI